MQPPMDRWGVTAELVPLTGGHRNLAFRSHGLDRDLVFKTTRRSPAAIDWLGAVHQIARACGFVVPTPLPSRAGRRVEDGWTCEPLIEGRALAADELPGLLPQIRRFQALARDLPQRPGFLSARDLLATPAGGDVDLAHLPDDLVRHCRAAWQAVAGQAETIVHGDLTPANLLRCPDGAVALLDWDECRRDLALFDLGLLGPASAAERRAQLAWEVACSWQIEPDHARRLALQLQDGARPAASSNP